MAGNVTSIEVRDFKGVEHLVLQPEGTHLVVLTGRNGAGKSSFLDAISEIIDPSGTRLTPKPIREGASEAVAEIVTDEIRLRRVWKKDDAGQLTAYALDGAKYPSGRDVVARLTGGQLFEPFAFVRLSEKEQRDVLLRQVDLGIDLDVVAANRAALFEQRTEANRDAKRLGAVVDSMPSPAPGQSREDVASGSLLEELATAQQVESDIRDATRDKTQAEALISDLEARLLEARETLATATAYLSATTAADTVEIRARLAGIEDANRDARAARDYDEAAAAYTAAAVKAEILDSAIKALDQTKADALAEAKFPVPGLSVDESGLLVDGVPFKQVNTARQIEVAFSLATAADRGLRLVIIREGSLLDTETLATIRRVAEARDYLVLVEKVAEGTVGFEYVGGAA